MATRLEAELGEEQQRFIEGDPSDWDLLPLPDGCFKVGIDGDTYVIGLTKHNFEVIVGKSMRAFTDYWLQVFHSADAARRGLERRHRIRREQCAEKMCETSSQNMAQ